MLLTSDNDLAQEAELTRMGLYTIAKVFEVKLQYLINKFNVFVNGFGLVEGP